MDEKSLKYSEKFKYENLHFYLLRKIVRSKAPEQLLNGPCGENVLPTAVLEVKTEL